MTGRLNGQLIKEALGNLTEAVRANPRLANGTTTVRVGRESDSQLVGRVRQFEPILVDEPPAFGGSDQGPNPSELLLVALGACQHITLMVLAEQLGVEIDDIEIEVEGDIDLRGFLGLDPAIRPGFQQIRLHVSVQSPEPEERLRALLALAEQRCPVADMLRHPVPIEVTLEVAQPVTSVRSRLTG